MRTVARVALAILMVAAGVLHFLAKRIFVQIVPPWLPARGALVFISGVFEIALGLLLLVPRARRLAGYGLVALYLAVFPANIYMAVAHVRLQGMPSWYTPASPTAPWLRLPFQAGLIAWSLWVSSPARVGSSRERTTGP